MERLSMGAHTHFLAMIAHPDAGVDRYWTRDITQLNSHFGTDADLRELTSALHSRGMYLMVDIVVNQ